MCLSKAFLEYDSARELVLADITKLELAGDKLILTSLFGERKEVAGKLKSVDFVANTVTVAKT
jgi:predicted RNA-binding protein